MDYAISTPLVFNATISAGLKSLPFIVDISDDMLQEDNETFYMELMPFPSCLPLKHGISRSIVTIINTEGSYMYS